MHGARTGTVLDDRYQLHEQIGGGLTRAVYRASHVRIDKGYAIKIVHAELANDEAVRARLAASALRHTQLDDPGCVIGSDFGVDPKTECSFLAMELIGGQDLRSVIGLVPIAVPRAVAMIRRVLATLVHAHARGIVHGDLKPGHLMIDGAARDRVVVLDFDGTGTLAADDPAAPYASPERLRGDPIDARSDVYSVGVLLAKLLTDVNVDAALDAALRPAIAMDPAARYGSAAEFADRLASVS